MLSKQNKMEECIANSEKLYMGEGVQNKLFGNSSLPNANLLTHPYFCPPGAAPWRPLESVPLAVLRGGVVLMKVHSLMHPPTLSIFKELRSYLHCVVFSVIKCNLPSMMQPGSPFSPFMILLMTD